MIVKIKKGKHSPLLLFKRLFSSIIIFLFKKEYKLSHIIRFTDKSFFQFEGYDVFDYSKILGFSFGHHQKNESFRFGFRMINNDKIQISLYSYVGEKRYVEKLCEIDYDKDYLFEMLFIKKDKTVYYRIIELKNDILIVDTFEKVISYKWWGYRLFPYIGGNNPAPKNIEFYMKKV
jgi:hypothetical protein